jgi:hypothetical protein
VPTAHVPLSRDARRAILIRCSQPGTANAACEVFLI